MDSHPTLLRAQFALVAAELDLKLKDNEFTATSEIALAREAKNTALASLEDTRNDLKTALDSVWSDYATQLEVMPLREQALKESQDEYASQKVRFDKGLISKLDLLQSQIDLAESIISLSKDRQSLVTNILALAIAAQLDLWKN